LVGYMVSVWGATYDKRKIFSVVFGMRDPFV